jgi:hypothetical protein
MFAAADVDMGSPQQRHACMHSTSPLDAQYLVCIGQVYKAERSVDPLRVYNLRYDDSAETDQFSAGLARERRSLESLIADKAHMVLPANPDPTQVCAALLAT